MTPQEQEMLGGLIDRVQKTQLAEKDMDAEQMLEQGLGQNPDALYILAQTVLVQKYALEQAQAQLTQAKAQMQHPEPDQATAAPHKFGGGDAPAGGERNRYVIISDMKSGSITGLEEEIFNLGPAHRFMPQAWVLTSEASLNTIRHALMQKLGKLDTIFVVDTIHDRAAWFNFGPEVDTRIRRNWARTPEPSNRSATG